MKSLVLVLALQLCTQWQEQHIGTLQTPIDEASGVALSRAFPGRMYHVNDSGSGGVIYATDMQGKQIGTIGIKDFAPIDMEELRLGPCGNGRSCLFIGDIGDND